jgi:hypothetical protein
MNNKHNKKGIINQITKRFQTTIIGSLARFEDTFGYLWGHNSDKELTEKQQEFLDMWDHVRTSILNHGNNQMREAIDEIIEHIEKENNMFKYHFIVKNNKEQL